MQLPVGIPGWTIFATGLLIVAYRVHGIDSPRQWIEWVERRFVKQMELRILGAVLIIAAGALSYLDHSFAAIIGWSYVFCIVLLFIVGILLALLQNHARHLVLATAEASDTTLRVMSSVFTLSGLGLALLPFFF